MPACLPACLPVCLSVCLYLCMHACMHVDAHVSRCKHGYSMHDDNIYIYICIYVFTCPSLVSFPFSPSAAAGPCCICVPPSPKPSTAPTPSTNVVSVSSSSLLSPPSPKSARLTPGCPPWRSSPRQRRKGKRREACMTNAGSVGRPIQPADNPRLNTRMHRCASRHARAHTHNQTNTHTETLTVIAIRPLQGHASLRKQLGFFGTALRTFLPVFETNDVRPCRLLLSLLGLSFQRPLLASLSSVCKLAIPAVSTSSLIYSRPPASIPAAIFWDASDQASIMREASSPQSQHNIIAHYRHKG